MIKLNINKLEEALEVIKGSIVSACIHHKSILGACCTYTYSESDIMTHLYLFDLVALIIVGIDLYGYHIVNRDSNKVIVNQIPYYSYFTIGEIIILYKETLFFNVKVLDDFHIGSSLDRVFKNGSPECKFLYVQYIRKLLMELTLLDKYNKLYYYLKGRPDVNDNNRISTLVKDTFSVEKDSRTHIQALIESYPVDLVIRMSN